MSVFQTMRQMVGPNRSRLPAAVAFVDFEHWFFSMQNLYHIKPNYKRWQQSLAKKYHVTEMMIFADFSIPALRNELPKLREITNLTVDTQNTSPHHKKDFTDFIMLDMIYQRAMTAQGIDTFIILTGDGHFSSVASFLINRCRKKVGVYGVRGAISNRLKNVATWYEELPGGDDGLVDFYPMVMEHFSFLQSRRYDQRRSLPQPTVQSVAETVSKRNNLNVQLLRTVLEEMISKGYLTPGAPSKAGEESTRSLSIDWERLARDGFWREMNFEKPQPNNRGDGKGE